MEYYHGVLSRDDAEKMIKGRENGTFLLRKSPRSDGSYVISMAFQGDCFHYSIHPKQEGNSKVYCIQNGTAFGTLEELCKHYMMTKGGLKVKLGIPITKPVEDHYVTEVDWFHNCISREEDSKRLSQGYRMQRCDGLFLVRKKETDKYVLSVVSAGRVYRYIIHYDQPSEMYCMSGKHKKFPSLDEFIKYHSQNAPSVTGIQTKLTYPCPKPTAQASAFQIPESKTAQVNPLRNERGDATLSDKFQSILPKDGLNVSWDPEHAQSSQRDARSQHQKLLQLKDKRKWLLQYMEKYKSIEEQPGFKSIYWNYSTDGVLPDLFVNKKDVAIYEQLGKGHFGAVCLGCCNIRGEQKACAIKFLTGDDVVANKSELLAEATLMQKLDHPNIIRLMGVCESDPDIMMLLELAPLGPFKDFIRSKNETTFPESKIANIMVQVCYGMRYLASQNIVHRDLAARNILLVSENFAKVSDFGMSKVLMESENYYRSTQPGTWPLRWYSPEALNFYKFTTKCDVWSYGVTLWEAFSYGDRPYRGMKGYEILQMIDRNERLECPLSCPPEYYDLMLHCWTYNEDERPTFADIAAIMDNMSTQSQSRR